MSLDLPLVFAILMGFAILMYVLLDGYDLGVGMLMPAADSHQQELMVASIGPFWDANETWLVLGVGILLVAFPAAHGIVLGALYLPVVAMLIGSLMLIKSDAEFFQISWAVILPVVTLTSAFTLLVIGTGINALRRRPVTGREEMVGLVGIARTALAPDGQLAVRGELWEGISEQPVSAGDPVEVTAVDGLRLRVKPYLKKKEVRA